MRKMLSLVLLGLLLLGITIFADGDETPTPGAIVGRRAAVTPMPTATMPDENTLQVDITATCEGEWFFDEFKSVSCPAGASIMTNATFQRFEYGYMIWLEATDEIYVLHTTVGDPNWFAAPDGYVAGDPERDLLWKEPQPPLATQPRFGFGVLWRNDAELRHRIGWAAQPWEIVYDAQIQTAIDGTIFIEEPNGGVFVLPPDDLWLLYSGR